MVERPLCIIYMSNLPPFAVITGASRGIGAEYAKALAARGYELLLVARDQIRLEQLAKKLHHDYSVQVWTQSLDLAQAGASERLHRLAGSYRPQVSMLVNNAGFGMYGLMTDMPLSRIQDMLQVHIHMTTESMRLFLPDMMKQGHGIIINVASVAGLFPIPYMAAYAATKAYLIALTEGVAMEARKSGVIIQACCPGYTDTDFHQTANHRPRHLFPPHSSHDVVHTSLKALKSRKILVTIGWTGLAAKWIARWMPKRWLMALSGRFVRPYTPT